MQRRNFVRHLAAGAALAGLPAAGRGALSDLFRTIAPVDPAPERLRILMLGGRRYVGPQMVRAALERGHEVTLFNRGFTNPDMFPYVEHLRGNRFADRGIGLNALRGDREWDVVFDTWQREPGCVNDAAELLAGRAKRYVYVSSISVFPEYEEHGMDERSPTVEAEDLVDSFDPELGYRHRKRAGELAAGRHFGDDALVLRCHAVRGLDPGRINTEHWPFRFMSGEPILIPDDPDAVIQWTDVTDIGRFAVHAVENDVGGIYHLMNTREPFPLLDWFDAWHQATGRRSPLVRAPLRFLREKGVEHWNDLPQWVPAEAGFYRISADRAHDTGFPFRPLGETIADIIRSRPSPPAPEISDRLPRQWELELIWELTGGDLPA